MKERKRIIGIVSIALFIFITAVSSVYLEIQIRSGYICECSMPLWIILPFLSSLGLILGFISYLLLKDGENNETLEKLVFRLVSKDEEKTVLKIILKKKIVKQNELVKLTGFDKVKVHRILKSLELRGVIRRHQKGKIRIVELNV